MTAPLPPIARETTARPAPPPWVPSDGRIRVGLAAGRDEIRVEVGGAVEVVSDRGDRILRRDGPGLLLLRPAGRGLRIQAPPAPAVETSLAAVQLRGVEDEVRFAFKGNDYGGVMRVLRDGEGGLTLVHVVDLETYLRGVVPWEIGRPGDEALAAVKAQAVAARTYTVSHLGRREALGFDLWDSTDDQVYRGLTGVHAVTDRAVRETAGQVLRHGDDLVQAYYSSTCGGHTSAIQEVWPRAPIPYLQGVRDAPAGESAWCRESPHFRWSVAWTARELGEVVRANLPTEVEDAPGPREIGVVRGVEVVERDRSGRVRRLRIRTDRGSWEVVGDRIRWVLRPREGRFAILRSTLFNVEEFFDDAGDLVALRLSGGGFGHGIGLCQIGAMAMARAGADLETILVHYYPGTRLTRLEGGRREWIP